MLSDIQVTIPSLEVLGITDVIVMLQHRLGETLAKSAWTDKEEVLVGSLNLLYESSLVNIIA